MQWAPPFLRRGLRCLHFRGHVRTNYNNYTCNQENCQELRGGAGSGGDEQAKSRDSALPPVPAAACDSAGRRNSREQISFG